MTNCMLKMNSGRHLRSAILEAQELPSNEPGHPVGPHFPRATHINLPGLGYCVREQEHLEFKSKAEL